jgi:ribosomal protein S27E
MLGGAALEERPTLRLVRCPSCEVFLVVESPDGGTARAGEVFSCAGCEATLVLGEGGRASRAAAA